MRLTNATETVLDAVKELFSQNNHDPTIAEIAGVLGHSSILLGMVKRALPSVDLYLREELNLRVVPVNGIYYADPDLGGLGRKSPRNVPEARYVLAVAGRPIAGIVHIKNANGNGKHLWDAQLLFWHKVQLVMRQNYSLKLQGFVDRHWLEAGRLDNLSIQDIQQQLLTA